MCHHEGGYPLKEIDWDQPASELLEEDPEAEEPEPEEPVVEADD